MSLKALIIDDFNDFRMLLSHHITTQWPDAVVVEHDPVTQGKLPNHFTGSGYDVVLLDHELGEENGLDWLRHFKQRPGFPPIIFMTAKGDELLAVKAIKSGAEDYIPKQKITHEFIVQAIKNAVRKGKQDSALFDKNRDKDDKAPSDIDIPGYRIIKPLSRGMSSSVLLAHSDNLDKEVVLKVLLQIPESQNESASAFERFIQEYEVITKLNHPNIVKIYSHGASADQAFIAMEYFARGDLKKRLKEVMSASLAITYLRQMTEAMCALHQVGILHRDLKPANVMVREDDSIALIDFGLAKQTQVDIDLTLTGEIFGTPYYMSPEQGHGDPVDERSDLYSLGVIFYEMLMGKKPYVAATPLAVIYKHSHADIPFLSERLSRYQQLINLLMAKDPADRLQTAQDLLDYLDKI
ncbi:MAG: protein kinase [Gammaproteobacteria bacterium]|nr:protein kinase [Gammaproteobacteria bacterium]NNC96954.1 protein kinase [Gammaproteobacteria bacterium]NNM14576.1 protein kinase [Gammaproteobacteria bacterium]